MKLWNKGYTVNKLIEAYTVGDDYILDLNLVEYDCIASKAHAKMLSEIGVLTREEYEILEKHLNEIMALSEKRAFKIEASDEDCHTAIEKYLVEKCGDIGKKIHTGRSRNDQVLTAVRLYEKEMLIQLKTRVLKLVSVFQKFNEKNGAIIFPGYTHMQKAMPTNFSNWSLCFEEGLDDDTRLIDACLALIDQSPLGSAAGFGVPSLGLDMESTRKTMNFSRNMRSPMYAQHSRGKFESEIIHVCSMIMFDLNKLANDLILFNMQEFKFVTLPKELCTGSSIMPQKLNPDLLEIMRANYHVVLGEEMKLKSLSSNLISGYNRDLQLTKGPVMSVFNTTFLSIEVAMELMENMTVNAGICELAMSEELFLTEKAYDLVRQGVPFREAYKIVGTQWLEKKEKNS